MPRFMTIATVAVLVMLIVAPSLAQVVANDAYQVDYFSKFGLLHVMRIINTGQVGSPIDPTTKHGTVCADIYAFDANQEMISCCSCPITANGIISFFTFGSEKSGAGAPPVPEFALMGIPPESGVIKVVADAETSCDPRTITSPINGALRAFGTQLGGFALCTPDGTCQSGPLDGTGTETEFQRAPLTQAEQSFLGNACSFVLYLGSGRGQCLCPLDVR